MCVGTVCVGTESGVAYLDVTKQAMRTESFERTESAVSNSMSQGSATDSNNSQSEKDLRDCLEEEKARSTKLERDLEIEKFFLATLERKLERQKRRAWMVSRQDAKLSSDQFAPGSSRQQHCRAMNCIVQRESGCQVM